MEEILKKRIKALKARIAELELANSHQRKHIYLMEDFIKKFKDHHIKVHNLLDEDGYNYLNYSKVKRCREKGCVTGCGYILL